MGSQEESEIALYHNLIPAMMFTCVSLTLPAQKTPQVSQCHNEQAMKEMSKVFVLPTTIPIPI